MGIYASSWADYRKIRLAALVSRADRTPLAAGSSSCFTAPIWFVDPSVPGCCPVDSRGSLLRVAVLYLAMPALSRALWCFQVSLRELLIGKVVRRRKCCLASTLGAKSRVLVERGTCPWVYSYKRGRGGRAAVVAEECGLHRRDTEQRLWEADAPSGRQ